MVEAKTNSVSSLLRCKTDEILVTKTEKGNQLKNIDIVAINEWITQKDGVEFFNILRAFALLCNIIEGLEEIFFTIARELPTKLELEDLTTESIMENFEGINKEILTPFDYIKTLQVVFSESPKTKTFTENFTENFLQDKMKEISLKFKIVTMEEYEELVKKRASGDSVESSANNFDYVAYANSIKFSRTVLRSDYGDI